MKILQGTHLPINLVHSTIFSSCIYMLLTFHLILYISPSSWLTTAHSKTWEMIMRNLGKKKGTCFPLLCTYASITCIMQPLPVLLNSTTYHQFVEHFRTIVFRLQYKLVHNCNRVWVHVFLHWLILIPSNLVWQCRHRMKWHASRIWLSEVGQLEAVALKTWLVLNAWAHAC